MRLTLLLPFLTVLDIWSCGVILYQLLSLLVDVPFDPVDLILSRGVVPPLSQYTQTALSEDMHAIVMKALEVDPAKRWQSAEEMGDALHQEEARLLDGNGTRHRRINTARVAATIATNTEAANSSVATAAAAAAASITTPYASTTASATASAAAPLALSSSAFSRITSPGIASTPAAIAAAAAATKESQLHPRFQRARRGMAFSSEVTTSAAAPPITSKL